MRGAPKPTQPVEQQTVMDRLPAIGSRHLEEKTAQAVQQVEPLVQAMTARSRGNDHERPDFERISRCIVSGMASGAAGGRRMALMQSTRHRVPDSRYAGRHRRPERRVRRRTPAMRSESQPALLLVPRDHRARAGSARLTHPVTSSHMLWDTPLPLLLGKERVRGR